MRRCKDCRWWNQTIQASAILSAVGTCMLTESEAGYPFVNKNTLAIALPDDEEQHAYLQTCPAFGCVQFEAQS